MSIENIKKYLHSVKALDNYDEVETEKNKLKLTIQQERIFYRQEVADKDATISRLNKRNKYLEGIRRKYKNNDYSLEEFDALVNQGIDEETDRRITLGVLEKYQQQKPNLAISAIKNQLRLSENERIPELQNEINKKAEFETNHILNNEAQWPTFFYNKVNTQIQEGIKNGLNQTFWDSVNQQAQQEINKRVQVTWPTFLNTYFTPRVKNIFTTELMKLTTIYQFNCSRCGIPIQAMITADTIAALLQLSYIQVPCPDPNCKGLINHHSTKISLGEVVYQIIQNTPIVLKGQKAPD